jgi:aminotransferase EvaB
MIIPFNELSTLVNCHRDQIQAAASRVIESGWYVLGPEVDRFEAEFAAYCGTAHAIGVANGTDALEIAMRAAGVTCNSEVITVANAGGYSTLACRAIGATPVYCEIDPDTLLMDINSISPLITGRTRAVIATHLYGMVVDIHKLRSECHDRPHLVIIEDCAQAHGAMLDGRRTGSLGDLAAFSFYPTKNLGALGDGGAITTSSVKFAQAVRSLRQYGWKDRYDVQFKGGRNSRLDEIQAAVLRVLLPHLDRLNERRREVVAAYISTLADSLTIPHRVYCGDHVGHLFVVQHPERDRLRKALQQHGIGTAVHFPIPDHRQDGMFDPAVNYQLPETERSCNELLSLPCHPFLAEPQIAYICQTLNQQI